MIMEAAISSVGCQRCPRWRIHATIGSVMVAAMPRKTTDGASSRSSDVPLPIAFSAASPGRPNTIMPANITTTISM